MPLINTYFKKEQLQTLLSACKDKPGVAVDFWISNETNQYGQNVAGHIAQTKDERDAKKKKVYVSNGKVVIGGSIERPASESEPSGPAQSPEPDDLPF